MTRPYNRIARTGLEAKLDEYQTSIPELMNKMGLTSKAGVYAAIRRHGIKAVMDKLENKN